LSNDNYFISSSYRELLNDKWSLFIGGGYTYNKDLISEQFRVETDEQSAQSKITLQYAPTSKINVKTGAEFIYNQYLEGFTNSDGTTFNTRLFENYSAAFAEGEWNIGRKMA